VVEKRDTKRRKRVGGRCRMDPTNTETPKAGCSRDCVGWVGKGGRDDWSIEAEDENGKVT
jgi:hypothetical protein